MNDSLICSEKLIINNKLRDLIYYNELDNNSLNNFINLPTSNYSLKQIEKLKTKIEQRNNDIKELNTRLELLLEGKLNDELKKKVEENKQIINEKSKETKKKKDLKRKEKEEDSKLSKEYYEKHKKSDRIQNTYIIKRYYNYFKKSVETLPEWIKSDLEKMPCNKGYIWRGVHYYGVKNKDNSNNLSVTECKKGEKIIHVWTKDMYKMYSKKGRNKQILIKEEKRKIKV